MTLENLIGILKIQPLVNIDNEKKTITIITPIVKIGPISFASAESFASDYDKISVFLQRTFVERKIMWHDFKKETLEWSKESIKEISEIIEDFIKEIQENSNRKDDILKDYLIAFQSFCNLTLKEIRDAEFDEREQRDALVPLDDILFAEDQLEFILKDFREKSYPMIQALANALPSDRQMKKLVFEKLRVGANLQNINIEDIIIDGLE